MNAYQNFLDFFSMHNRERLDGLDESYFSGMTDAERKMAFNYLLAMVQDGGGEESVNGLFTADAIAAWEPVDQLLSAGLLRPAARIVAASHLYRGRPDSLYLQVFYHYMADPDARLRRLAVLYLPPVLTPETKTYLHGMVRTETDEQVYLQVVTKILRCYGINGRSVGKDIFLGLYAELHSEDSKVREKALLRLEDFEPGMGAV